MSYFPAKLPNKKKSKPGTDGHLKDLKSQTFQHTWQFSKVKGAPGWGADKVVFFLAYKGIGALWPACLKKKPFGGIYKSFPGRICRGVSFNFVNKQKTTWR